MGENGAMGIKGQKGETGGSAKIYAIVEDIKSIRKQIDEMRCNCK